MHKILFVYLMATSTILFSSAPSQSTKSPQEAAETDAYQLAHDFYNKHKETFQSDNPKGNAAGTAAYLAGIHFELLPTLIEEQRKTNALLAQLIALLAAKPASQVAALQPPQLQLVPPAHFGLQLPPLAPPQAPITIKR